MSIFSRLFGRGKSTSRVTTVDNPYRIANPTIGFLNLDGPSGAALAAADREVLSPLFNVVRFSEDAPPRCDVLFIYCALDADGGVASRPQRIRDLIKDAGAYIAVIATENAGERCGKALGRRTDWHANIVMLIDRKGEKFAKFFRRLFEEMKKGRSMVMVWVDLAPQGPMDHPDAPGAIVAVEAGHVTFGTST